MALIQHLYGLSPLRKTADGVSTNICCRRFLGYMPQEKPPISRERLKNFFPILNEPLYFGPPADALVLYISAASCEQGDYCKKAASLAQHRC